jgi:hypothetical protein
MERSELALRRVRFAYERAHVAAAARGIAIAAALVAVALALQPVASATWFVAAALAASLAALGWRGGAIKRGAFAGVLAGLPPLVAPTIVFAFGHGGHCPSCEIGPTLPCLLACFGSSTLVGTLVGYRAARDASPRRFGLAAIATAALTAELGCCAVGLGGALGIAIGLVAGGVTGWVVAGRTARA